MIHNIVVVDGQEYKAVENNTCDGCAFYRTKMCNYSTPCDDEERDDHTKVIYKPHYKLKHK